MLVNKIGYEHSQYWTNCHDFGFEYDNIKCVVDGCSEGLHSEVGAKTFCHLFQKCNSIDESFKILTSIFEGFEDIKNHLLFTILFVEELEDKFIVNICGDGYIIKQKHDDSISYEEINYDGAPPYYAYNFVPQEHLSKYKDGVAFQQYEFSKEEYKAIGVATDGISYIINSWFKDEFEALILERKAIKIKRFINREHKLFKDDITIAI